MEEKKVRAASVGKKKRIWVLVVGAVVGVLLILLGNADWPEGEGAGDVQVQTETDPMLLHMQLTEEKIAALCARVQGVGQVDVIVTFEGDFTYVYATDTKETQKESGKETQTTYITVGSGAAEQPVLITRTYPTVSGIGIVCEGGGDAGVRSQLLSLLSATYGIGANKIYIAPANPSR